jgi:hypothetical protein
MKKVLKPFDIEKAKEGARIITKSGKNVNILKYDLKVRNDYCIVATVELETDVEVVYTYDTKGRFYQSPCPDDSDLIIEENDFEDGDIIADDKGCVAIFKKYTIENQFLFYAQLGYKGNLVYDYDNAIDIVHLATEQEKKKLFDALAKEDKRWNAEKKAIEDVKEEKKCEFKRGQAVLVRDNDSEIWRPAIFIDYNYDSNHHYPFITTNGRYKMCIDYDSNRELVYTQNNPK